MARKLPRWIAQAFSAIPVIIVIAVVLGLFPGIPVILWKALLGVAIVFMALLWALAVIAVFVAEFSLALCFDWFPLFIAGTAIHNFFLSRLGLSEGMLKFIRRSRVILVGVAILSTFVWVAVTTFWSIHLGESDVIFGIGNDAYGEPEIVWSQFFDLLAKHLIVFGIYLGFLLATTLIIALSKGWIGLTRWVWSLTK